MLPLLACVCVCIYYPLMCVIVTVQRSNSEISIQTQAVEAVREADRELSRCSPQAEWAWGWVQGLSLPNSANITTKDCGPGLTTSLSFRRSQKSGLSVKLLDFSELGSILLKHTHNYVEQITPLLPCDDVCFRSHVQPHHWAYFETADLWG